MFNKKHGRSEKILILGLGGVGYYLAKRLVHDGYAVTAIEPDKKLVQYADGDIDARLIWGSAMSFQCWKEAEAQNMDYMIAVTNNDAVNILASQIAHRFGIPKKIARIRSTEFGSPDSVLTRDDMKIDLIIHPEELAAQEISRLLKIRAANEIIEVAGGQLQVMACRIRESSPLAGKYLKDISQLDYQLVFRVVAIARGITTIIPGGDNQILPQDLVLIMAPTEDLPKVMDLAGVTQESRQRVMILGGGLVGRRIAELLGNSITVKLIEKDEEQAEELSHCLKYTEVLCGDGSDANILNTAGLLDMDTFITATGDNETNIMSCILTKHLMSTVSNGVNRTRHKTIALVSNENYQVLAATIGADLVLNKKVMAGNEILKFIRRGEILSVAHLHGFDTEVVELVAAPDSPITKKPLSKLDPHYRGKIMVGGVYRDGEWNIGVGDTHIQPDERVLVVCGSPQLKDVQKLFLN